MTMLALDHLIFGNGRGLATPYSDGVFYWLDGDLYTFHPGYGAQLRSFQWTHPRAGEVRRLCGRDFRPFHSVRRWGRVEVAWRWIDLPAGLEAANAALADLRRDLGDWSLRTRGYVWRPTFHVGEAGRAP